MLHVLPLILHSIKTQNYIKVIIYIAYKVIIIVTIVKVNNYLGLLQLRVLNASP